MKLLHGDLSAGLGFTLGALGVVAVVRLGEPWAFVVMVPLAWVAGQVGSWIVARRRLTCPVCLATVTHANGAPRSGPQPQAPHR